MKQGEVAVRELLLSFDESWSWVRSFWKIGIYISWKCIFILSHNASMLHPHQASCQKAKIWCPVYRPVPGLIDLKSNSNQNMAYIERIYMVTLMDPTCYTL